MTVVDVEVSCAWIAQPALSCEQETSPDFASLHPGYLLPLLYQAKVGALSIEFANPAPARVPSVKENPLPAEMILIPGLIDTTTTNFVEYPQVVANRICEQ